LFTFSLSAATEDFFIISGYEVIKGTVLQLLGKLGEHRIELREADMHEVSNLASHLKSGDHSNLGLFENCKQSLYLHVLVGT
jgi:hypothetical protein